ncbi:hypothetical protein [Streptomyces cyslabdanicus]|uniref:hypothetical protein n=1 Tax=Streptomyces cyslabdanicus TaxID=1470456 RepID=UPI00404418D5
MAVVMQQRCESAESSGASVAGSCLIIENLDDADRTGIVTGICIAAANGRAVAREPYSA